MIQNFVEAGAGGGGQESLHMGYHLGPEVLTLAVLEERTGRHLTAGEAEAVIDEHGVGQLADRTTTASGG